ncbi:hypothetical protein Bsel_0779 [[Bacillus] selenitireducens MLS10]|uniref:Uncharacterized protein n=1 Tax=Bacillus selenitireducens (strain ATCC 700615 / DSM 15326 / MLS10) TaxID=439292 RepID=D6XZD4_BACIE|nr:hypothetical protein Bsel_0779 [[Bacillus] selenitireducens MLS10]
MAPLFSYPVCHPSMLQGSGHFLFRNFAPFRKMKTPEPKMAQGLRAEMTHFDSTPSNELRENLSEGGRRSLGAQGFAIHTPLPRLTPLPFDLVDRTLILQPCFPVVTRFTEGLPVVLVPEQGPLPPVGYFVVNDGPRHHPTSLFTPDTERVAVQVMLPCLAPPAVVTTARSARSLGVRLRMRLAVGTVGDVRTVRMLARALRSLRHSLLTSHWRWA